MYAWFCSGDLTRMVSCEPAPELQTYQVKDKHLQHKQAQIHVELEISGSIIHAYCLRAFTASLAVIQVALHDFASDSTPPRVRLTFLRFAKTPSQILVMMLFGLLPLSTFSSNSVPTSDLTRFLWPARLACAYCIRSILNIAGIGRLNVENQRRESTPLLCKIVL